MKTPTRYRRRRSAAVLQFDSWNFDAEPGDLMVNGLGQLFRLEESRGRNQRDSATLYARKIQPPADGLVATIRGGEVYWRKSQEEGP